jgi:hypothetical protein
VTRAITRLAQPTESTCGQTVLAMLTGVSVASVIRKIGGGPTTVDRLRLYLIARGWMVAANLKTGRGYRLESLAVVRALWEVGPANPGLTEANRRHRGHWMLWSLPSPGVEPGRVLDPASADPWVDGKHYDDGCLAGRITSWFWVVAPRVVTPRVAP